MVRVSLDLWNYLHFPSNFRLIVRAVESISLPPGAELELILLERTGKRQRSFPRNLFNPTCATSNPEGISSCWQQSACYWKIVNGEREFVSHPVVGCSLRLANNRLLGVNIVSLLCVGRRGQTQTSQLTTRC